MSMTPGFVASFRMARHCVTMRNENATATGAATAPNSAARDNEDA